MKEMHRRGIRVSECLQRQSRQRITLALSNSLQIGRTFAFSALIERVKSSNCNTSMALSKEK